MTDVEIQRSARRRKTVQAFRKDGRTIVQVPAHLTPEQERECVDGLLASLERRERRRTIGDDDLTERARRLDSGYFEGRADPVSVRWVSNQNRRWGSCTLRARTIRLSDRLTRMPLWVIDYVLVHELAHLVAPHDGHGREFRALVARYPQAERAEGFLRGIEHARGGGQSSDPGPGSGESSLSSACDSSSSS